MLDGKESSATSFPDQGGISALDRPNPYDDLVMPNLFGSSRTWSTMPTTEEWVDETVESLALSRSTTQQQQNNWTALQGSPVIGGGRDATAPVSLPELVSSLRLPQVQTGLEEQSLAVPCPAPLRPKTAPVGSKGVEIPQMLGLEQKSQSNGLSLRSEGSKSDYAVFI
jgi:axial budding pattern protein 2